MKERKISTKARIISGNYDQEFSKSVAEQLDVTLDIPKITRFANSEVKVEVPAVRGNRVFVIQSHGAPVDQNLMQHVALINAAKRAAAAEVTAVVPYRGYSRADRPDNSHESYMGPIAMRMLAMAGADRIVEIDPHTGQAAGFLPDFNVEYTAIPAHPAIYDYLEQNIFDTSDVSNIVMVAPDAGRAKTNRKYADHYGTELAIVDKMRTGANRVEASRVVGEVAGKLCIVIDDMIDTAGTTVKGAEALRQHGASEVIVVATHGVLSDPAIERLCDAKDRGIIGRIAVTNTLRLPDDAKGLIETISVAPLLGQTIRNIFHDKSVSGMQVYQ